VSRPVQILGLILATALIGVCASASASVRLGPDLTPAQNGTFSYGCQVAPYTPCSYVNLRSTDPTIPVAAPFSGVITKWRFRAACCIPSQTEARSFTLKTFKLGPSDGFEGYGYFIAGNAGPSFVVPPGNQVPSSPAVELPARLPITSGERIGIVADNPIAFATYAAPAVTLVIGFNNFEYMGQQYGSPKSDALAINAELEADADGDGYGDETQDCKPADPSFHEACATVPTGPPQGLPSVFVDGGKCTGTCGGGATLRGPIQAIPAPRGDGGVEIALACPPNASSPCGGILYAELPGAKKPRPLARAAAQAPMLLGKVAYTVKPGKTKELKLSFAKKVRDFPALKPTRRVTVTVDPKAGKTITRTVVLHFKPARPSK
jgi:hypothetical protein